MDIPINSLKDYIGLILLALGGFMVLAGFDIISVQQVTVKKGRRTWVMGIAFALFGIILLFPGFKTSTPTTSSPTAITLATQEILQEDQQAKCGKLKLDAINPPTVLENESREYKLTGSGFCNNTIITISGYAYVGNSHQSINSQPVEVASDGTWLTVYIYHVLDPDQSGGYVMVENPDGNTASLYVNYQR